MPRQFLSNIETNGLIDGVDVSNLQSSVISNSNSISSKANLSDIPNGTLNGDDVGKLISINFDSDLSIITFEFEGGNIEASVSSIS